MQSQAEIRGEIVRSMAELNRPATVVQITRECFRSSRIDGTSVEVNCVVSDELYGMAFDGLVEEVEPNRYTICNVLDAMVAAMDVA